MLVACSFRTWLPALALLIGAVIPVSVAMCATPATQPTLVVSRSIGEGPADTRYDYYWKLLDMALRATEADYGPYRVEKVDLGGRHEEEEVRALEAGDKITVLVRGNVIGLERRLLPIRFPLDKGLLGYRVFMIRKDTQPALNKVKTLDELTRFSIGQGAGWWDIQVLTNAGFRVDTGATYEGLFGMLAGGRFDLFSRGVMEVGEELNRFGPAYPNLAIEQNLMLHYPLTRYFFVSRTPAGKALANRINEGLERMLKDGSFDREFNAFKASFEATIHFKKRRLFRLESPFFSPETPLARKELWYDPLSER
ncbi:transporter substrate-binding domain-containing protein [Niveibacterium umoris]|uniref:Solute-binding protein family 3/N-terminal domain-containing protein n=1 Tax=Niveibacterium umoris TaxID=1193620 RepID=A0A840BRL0_9RHOO|nr:hypothetical protein [Niveibacterium umoris]MBB4013446.1 hypothetical protein [Niveibacterium umoris]